MKALIQLAICSTLLLGGAMAQHRGGGGGGGGFRGSGGGGFAHVGGGGFSGGGIGRGGGLVGGGYGGFGRGFGYGGYGRGYGYGFGGYYGGWGWGYPYYGYGLGYGYGYPYSYGAYYDPYAYSPDSYGYQGYDTSPNVTVVYPPAQTASASYGDRPYPVTRQYDQYGQQTRPTGQATGGEGSSPIYLVALKNHNIVAASSYSITGNTLHYFTLEHAEQQVALDAVDHDLTLRLNHERRVAFQFPSQ